MDPLDELIEELGRRRVPGGSVPLYVRATELLYERIQTLDDTTLQAMAAVGWQSIADAGACPTELPLPEVLAMIEAGETFSAFGARIPEELFDAERVLNASEGERGGLLETYGRLVLLGFCTLAAEKLMKADTDN